RNPAARQSLAFARGGFRPQGPSDRHRLWRDPARRSLHRLSRGERAAHGRRRFRRHHRHGRKLDPDRLWPCGRLGIADHGRRLHPVADFDLAAAAGARRRLRPLRLCADVSGQETGQGRGRMSAALLIDIILWASVAGVGYIAWRRGPKVMTASLREGSWDFINIVPRIAVGVIGSGYIAAVIPQEIITGWLGPNSGWLGVATAVVAGAATPGGPVVGFSIGAVGLKAGGGPPHVVAYVSAVAVFAFPRLLLWEIPFMPARFVWFRAAVSIPFPFLAAAIAMVIGKP